MTYEAFGKEWQEVTISLENGDRITILIPVDILARAGNGDEEAKQNILDHIDWSMKLHAQARARADADCPSSTRSHPVASPREEEEDA